MQKSSSFWPRAHIQTPFSRMSMECFLCGASAELQQVIKSSLGCAHAACIDCIRAHIQHQSRWHVPPSRMQCFHAECSEIMPRGCIVLACPDLDGTLDQRLTPATTGLDLGSQLRLAVLKRSFGNMPMVCAETGFASSPKCPVCNEEKDALLANTTCCHAACPECWTTSNENNVVLARERCQVEFHRTCLEPTCKAGVSDVLWRYIVNQSPIVASFLKDMRSEVVRFQRQIPKEALVWSTSPFDTGPICPSCKSPKLALLTNRCCGKALCEDCWATAVEKEIPYCRKNYVSELGIACQGTGCDGIVSSSIVAHLEAEFRKGNNCIAHFQKDVRSEIARLTKSAGQRLVLSKPQSPGPVCPICCERQLALISNVDCDHIACEDCWARWACEQLGHCRRQKRVDLQCFGANCRSPVSWAIWEHATTRNNAVCNLEKEFVYRRRLQTNELYPPEVQVDCPQAGCLGLGYHGFDTLMCFVCEHQWCANGTGESVDTNVEMLLGEAIKKCPACGEYIMKNGGCDHMTCRCKHEFFWSTLLPYRR